MALKQGLVIKQGQSLVMTPQLQQSLKILQFSNQELSEFIESELENNPLLEKSESIDDKEDKKRSDDAEITDIVDKSKEENIPSQDENDLDVDYENVWQDDNKGSEYDSRPTESSHIQGGGGGDNNFDSSYDASYYEKTMSEDENLRDHIMDQITLDFTSPDKKMIAMHLLDMLDESGYIPADYVGLVDKFDCEIEDIDDVLLRLQKIDPPGIFARSLQECLSIQLREKDRFDPAMKKLLDNLDLVAKGEIKKLERICGVDEEDIREMCREIRELDPKPASGFLDEVSETLIPDIFLYKDSKGEWALELNSEALPRVLVNNKYYTKVKSHSKDAEEKKYISEQYGNANWLIKAMNQRAETILKVAKELVTQQQEFFERGIRFMKPMVLSDIASKLDIHESTVGRVTTNKYISSPRGVFEMKYFFSSSIGSSADEGNFSSNTVKYLIKELIDKEKSAKNVLSDDKLSEILKSRGVDVARRTVAKYRESMNIPSSAQRKRQKKSVI